MLSLGALCVTPIPQVDTRTEDERILIMAKKKRSTPENPAADTGWLRWMLWLFLGIAVLCGGIALVAGIITAQVMARELSAPGRVVEFVGVAAAEDDETLYAPLVEFTAVDNERHLAQVAGGSRPPAYSLGEPVTVRYDPARPQSARIGTFWSDAGQYTLTLITGFIAAVFALATAMIRRFM